ncbi:hypothetical protein LOTGIDRAFT_234028 [Lottia gigantea]|uniref:Cadherin domain-containing protein n=1 Tax=Lottia gigantea TaxID=225164 RepID=V4A9E1_LOTGI|nr:hypothetical protein LOTGIDRAFT_234028 [Lottia gigantea]ESO89896.1 hypothetical protein LOTGIDRAFT_234028 [Lottia gigantea]
MGSSGRGVIICKQHSVVVTVNENEPIDTEVFTPSCSDTAGGDLSYSMKAGTPKKPYKKKFKIDALGVIRIKGKLNADYLHKFTIDIGVDSNSGASDVIYLGIKVLDYNDNKPVIKDVSPSMTLSEDATVGFKVTTCSANDKDDDPTHFEILNPTSPEASIWYLDRGSCDLYLNGKLDYETKTSYTLILQAVDSGAPPLTSDPESMVINVADVNDNYPVCPKYYKVVSLQEDYGTGIKIDGITCTDEDSDINGAVTYTLSVSNDASTMATFQVNSTTGDISLKSEVDYEDVDDNPPTWPVNPIFEDVSEVAPLGNIVFTLSANDADQANTNASRIKYEMLTPPNPDWFQIDLETGAVSVKSIMNRLTASSVTMDVIAYSDKSKGSGQVTVNVTIVDENNISPTFEEVFYQGNITENDGVGTYIFTVSAVDPEYGINGQISYYLNSPIFQVDLNSGDVSLKTSVDYETDTVHSLKIEARDLGTPPRSEFAFLLINVNPVNEFDPVIIGPSSPIDISEDAEPGTELFDFDANDMDDGMDGFVTFSIQTALSPFTIDPNLGVFRVASSLDREHQPSWDIIVVATDNSATNPKSTTTVVTINLLDINDNSPICNPLSSTTVPLGHHINTILSTVQCRDADTGSNGEFTFTKLSGDFKGAFDVDTSSGDITLLKKPTETTYTLSIEIKDKGNPQLSVVIAFNIIAEVQFNFTQLPTTMNVPEDTLPNEELIDIDACCTPRNVKYEIVNGNEDGHVILDPSSGKLILRIMFDYETKQSFSYRIRAIIVSSNTAIEEILNVNIEDSNDNAPKFTSSFHETSVIENISPSTSILKVKATDLDGGTNGEIVYSISGTGVSDFGIDSSGNLSVISPLDAETVYQYTLVITATDKGADPKSSKTTVVINVKNYDEFSPQIINMVDGVVVANVSEDSALGSPIFKIEAEDEDINTILTYSITAGNINNAFVIDNSTGDIFLTTILDRETTPQYNITVEINTQTSETVSALVVINILDVNDNDPKFDQDVYQLDVTHGDLVNKILKTFIIDDADSGTSADIASVTITDGDPKNHFKIEDTKLLTNVQIDYYTDKLYILTLKATDGGAIPRSGYTRVNINVLPKYNPPKFISNTYNKGVLEDVVPSDTIFDMDATSEGATEGVTGTITYVIQSGDSHNDFVISETTGIISIASEIDFERNKSYELVIIAKSKEDPLLTSSSTLSLSIQNVNDNRPIFNKQLYDFNVDENAVAGVIVGTVIATDADVSPFNLFTYSLGSATGSTDFIIDDGGNIKVDKPLSFITQSIYSIPVIADDGAHQTSSLIIIRINDINNNSPTFSPSSFSVGVVESMGIGNTFYTVKAQDLDTGTNGEIQYALVSGNFGNHLSLDPISGSLTVASNLDREVHDRFDLVIRAEDKGVPSALSGTLSLTVNVADVNDLNPTFTSSIEDVTVDRFAAPGTSVLAKTATDGDLGDNAVIVYEITSGNDDEVFLIDVSSGFIKTAADLSGAKNEYTLVITAKDKGIPPRSGTLTVKIQIIPLLSLAPSDQTMQIEEELKLGVSVGLVSPTHSASAVNYQIISGNFKNSFNMNPSTGEITTARKLDREEYETYILTVHVTDSGSVDYTHTVTVEVLDINDNDPVITTSDTNINVVENTPAGQIVAGFTVNDLDDGDNGLVDLKISTVPLAASTYFETDGNLLKIKQALDYESTTSITFQILAVDRGNPQRTGTIEVKVNVIDVDDGVVYTEDGEAPSIYMSRETSFYAADGEYVTTVTSAEYSMDANIGPFSFKSLNREGIFSVAEDGVVIVRKRGLLEPDTKYFVWIVVTAENGGDEKSVLGLLRVDTFHPNKHKLDVLFPNDQPRIWKIQEQGGPSRRKLLVASSETLIYVVEGQPLEDITDVKATKTFKDVNSLLNILRADPDEDTPKSSLVSNNYPVTAVNPYSEVISDGEEPEESFIASTSGIITIVMLFLVLLIIIIIIIVVIIIKKKKRQRENMNESSEELMPPEPAKIPRKNEITKPIGLGLMKEKKEKQKSNKTTTKTSLGTSDSSLFLQGNKRTTSISPSRLTPVTPVGTPTPRTPSEIEIADEKSSKSTKSGRLIQSLPQRKASTIDPVSGINNDSVDKTPVIAKRHDGPIVNRGKEYDGVAYDQEKGQRYAYNTRTGSTLWEEKDKGLGTGSLARRQKKRAQPKLTVVGEASDSNTLNLNLNRSIPMTNK